MPSQREALRTMREASYTQEDVEQPVENAPEHLEGGTTRPCAFERCTECRAIIIGWSAYQRSILVREPCAKPATRSW